MGRHCFLLIFLFAMLCPIHLRAEAPIVGDWLMTDGGARIRFAPARGGAGSFDIIWLDGPDLTILPGEIIGSAASTPRPGVYDCKVSTDPRGPSDKKNYARFVIKIDSDTGDAFSFEPYEQTVRFRIRALLPYWWRRPIKEIDSRPAGLDGATRVGAPKPYVEL